MSHIKKLSEILVRPKEISFAECVGLLKQVTTETAVKVTIGKYEKTMHYSYKETDFKKREKHYAQNFLSWTDESVRIACIFGSCNGERKATYKRKSHL